MMNKTQLVNALAAQRIEGKPYEFRVTEYIHTFATNDSVGAVLQQSLQTLRPDLSINANDIFVGYTSDSGEELRIRLYGNAREIYSQELVPNSKGAGERTQIMEPLVLEENAQPTRIIPVISAEPAIHDPAPREIASTPHAADIDPSGKENTRRIIPVTQNPTGEIVQVGANTRVVMPTNKRQ